MLINLLIVLIVVGAVLYLLKLVPIDQTIKTIIQVLVIVAVVVYVLLKIAAPLLEGRGML